MALGPYTWRGKFIEDRRGLDAMSMVKAWLGWGLVLGLYWIDPVAAHWPDQPAHHIADLGEFQFELGGRLANLRMSYVTHGTLNAHKSNAILLQHGFGANHHQYDHLIGPGRPLDTNRYFIIATDALGATQFGYEHSSSPTNTGLKMKFPSYNGRDMVKAQHRLITQVWGIERLLAVSGISSGADLSVQYAVSFPDFMDGIVPVVGGALWGTQGFFFLGQITNAITHCAGWNAGDYEDNPAQCATNALSALLPYFYTREWWDRHVDTPESYALWRNNWGSYYLDVQDARDLYFRTTAWGRGWVGDTPGFGGDLAAILGSIKARTLFIYSPQDQFYLPHHVDTQVRLIPDARAVAIDSTAGHLICCEGDPNATHLIGRAFADFLTELQSAREARSGRR